MALKRRNRVTDNAMKNVEVFTLNAPHARTNGVSGNGGGIRPGSARGITPRLSIFFLMEFNRRAGIQRSRLLSPILAPIWKVKYAPRIDPAVAMRGNAQNIS